MEKAKVVKVWPGAHVEVRLHISEEMEEDFKRCDKNILMRPECENCSWNNVKITGIFCCGTFAEEIRRQLEEK